VNQTDQRIDTIIREQSLYQCLECGKCSASCPRQIAGKEYSPRLLAHKLIAEREDETFIENAVWECLTCGLCEERCPSGVNISYLIREMRTLLAGTKGLKGFRAHDGALHSWMRMMTSPDLRQKRLDWLDPRLRVTTSGPVAFFAGCAPYFDVFFAGIEVDTLPLHATAYGCSTSSVSNRLCWKMSVAAVTTCCGPATRKISKRCAD
jgi:Fe-S oxidoreductase